MSNSEAPRYDHTQRGAMIPILLGAIGIIEIAIGLIVVFDDTRWIFFAAGVTLILVGWIFSALTIRVTSTQLEWRFGAGWPRKSVALSDIARAETVESKWWWGLGIHITPKGWLYNVAGKDVILCTRRNGKSFLLGTDDPTGLVDAINQHAGKP